MGKIVSVPDKGHTDRNAVTECVRTFYYRFVELETRIFEQVVYLSYLKYQFLKVPKHICCLQSVTPRIASTDHLQLS